MRSKKSINLIIKITIVFLSLYFLYSKLHENKDIKSLDKDYLIDLIYENQWGLILVVLMMFLNWIVEAFKWKFLINKIEEISIFRALRAIFSGITVSTFTPNRIGEYAGRVFCLDEANRIQAALITVLGSMTQLFTTILFGSIGIMFFLSNDSLYNSSYSMLYDNTFWIHLVIILGNFFLFYLYLHLSIITEKIKSFSWIKKLKDYLVVFTYYNQKELLKVLGLSMIRYFIFTTQFFILLRLFDVEVSYDSAIILIMIMLFILVFIPTIGITEISTRGSLAIMLLGILSENIFGILAATIALWIINLIAPAFIGTIFIFTLKFFRNN